MEQWKPVRGFEHTYEVSDIGNVRKIVDGKMLAKDVDKRGFTRVRLNGEKYAVHRMMARVFIPNPYGKSLVNYRDGDKTNLRAENLEWLTVEEMVRLPATPDELIRGKVYKNGFMEKARPVSCYTLAMTYKETFPSLQEAAKAVNTTAAGIHHALSGRVKSHRKLVWRYADVEDSVQ